MNTTSSTVISVCRSAEEVTRLVDEIERLYLLDRPRPDGGDRRAVERMIVTMPLALTPLDDELQPMDYQHHAITRDISCKGVGLVTTSPVRPSYVLLQFQPYHGESWSVVGRVAYCNDHGYYFHVGCEFLVC